MEGDERRAGWRKERQPWRRGERESGQLHSQVWVYSDKEERRENVKRRERRKMEIITQEESRCRMKERKTERERERETRRDAALTISSTTTPYSNKVHTVDNQARVGPFHRDMSVTGIVCRG